MIVPVVCGAGAGLGLWWLWRLVAPRPPSLSNALAALDGPGRPILNPSAVAAPPATGVSVKVRVARWLHRLGVSAGGRDAELALAGETVESFVFDRLFCAVGGFAGVVLVGVGVTWGDTPPVGAIAVLGAAAAATGWLLPGLLFRGQVKRRRMAFRQALSAYLDVVNAVLASGAGIETALVAAANRGTGWAFERIRGALDAARLTGRSMWDELARLGAQLGVNELTELASTVKLSQDSGAAIRDTLAARADTLRDHQVAQVETAAATATERMVLPVAVLALGFIVLIMFPPLRQLSTHHSPLPVEVPVEQGGPP